MVKNCDPFRKKNRGPLPTLSVFLLLTRKTDKIDKKSPKSAKNCQKAPRKQQNGEKRLQKIAKKIAIKITISTIKDKNWPTPHPLIPHLNN
jgi:hypothetical protein